MIKKTWTRWLPVFISLFASFILIAWAAFAESQIQGPTALPGKLSFQAYLPSHYRVYCQIDDELSNQKAVLSKMRLFPQITCRVQGAGYLNVLATQVWREGGLTRIIRDNGSGKTKILMPFAEFEILWPGCYELKTGFAVPTEEELLICVAPTGLVAFALILSMSMLVVGFILMLPKVFASNANNKKQPPSHANMEES